MQTWPRHFLSLQIMMSSSESPEDLRPAEDLLPPEAPLYFRKRKVSKTILDALGVSCQVAPSTAGEVALLKVDPAVAADVVAESDVAVTIASPTTDEAAVVTPVGVPMSTGLPPRFEFSDNEPKHLNPLQTSSGHRSGRAAAPCASSMSQVAQLEDVLMEEAPPPRARQRKTSKIFIEAFGGTCQVAPDYRRVSSQP